MSTLAFARTLAAGTPAGPAPGQLGAVGGVGPCVLPLLRALGWRGDARQVIEALPHFENEIDIADLRSAMARLGYVSRPVRTRLDRLDTRLLPCLFVPGDGSVMVILDRTVAGTTILDASSGAERTIGDERRHGTAYCFRRKDDPARAMAPTTGWFRALFARFAPTLGPFVALTLWLNLLALATPLFVMAVYDRVLAASSIDTLVVLLIGIGLALASDFAVRTLRARMLAHVGARTEVLVGAAVVERILDLPPHSTERAGIGAQIAKLKEFDRLRDAFSGHLALTMLELPFVAVFLAAIAILGGWLVAVPLTAMALYAVAALVIAPATRRAVAGATAASARRQAFLVEALANLGPLRRLGAETLWIERFRVRSAEAALATFRAGAWSSLAQTLTHGLMSGTGLAVLVFGASRVLDGTLSVGALVAVMALTWRALAPLHAGLGILGKLSQLRSSIVNVDRLMALKPERTHGVADTGRRRFAGRVTVSRASFRHGPEADPALIGVELDVRAGEVVAIAGPSGAGKSTLLRAVAGMVVPQAGGVFLDGINLRQIDPIRLRQSVAYLPQAIDLFHGTVAQNLRLAEPAATDDELAAAATMAGVLADIRGLPEGFETRLNEHAMRRLPGGFAQRLGLARTYLRSAEILLLDEPGTDLDAQGDRDLIAAIERLRGRSTVLIVTHRPSHMRAADRVAVLARGQLRAFDHPETVLPQLATLLQ